MDAVFKALDDPSRRLLLDSLFEQDGQTLTQLTARLPDMTRFGVMNHLRVLEEAGVVVTKKVGRSKHHYLNPVPIREVHDRWIRRYTEPWVGGLARLKNQLEEDGMTVPSHVYQTYIKCTPEAAWNAIVSGDLTVQYYYGTRVESDFTEAAPIRYLSPEGSVVADGVIIAVDEPHRLELMFHARWDQELSEEGPVRMVWIIDEANGLTSVTVESYMDPESKTYGDFSGGIPYIVAGMKTLLETGEPLGSGRGG
ncbi:MAG: helix-turn-helix domain-containing protein [Acidimicrobiia bacterium]|nr:helix-turn-helix domain-containing protein [Acidimicrobiia bacterium]